MIQKLINIFYRYPLAELKKYKRFGGYLSYRDMTHKRDLMKRSAGNLSPVKSYPDGLPVYFLTGKDYLYQTFFCIQSLVKCTTERFNFILVDDGSFDDKLMDSIKIQVPGATIFSKAIIADSLYKILPESVYPILHLKRKVYPHIKKLTDIHCLPGDDWKLVLDSDMLFWSPPFELIAWLKSPEKPLHLVDCDDSYGYPTWLIEEISGSKIKKRINVGAIGLNTKHVNWNKIEYWIDALETRQGTSYYLEQALTAMIIGDCQTEILNAEEYIVNPGENSKGKLHHYVDLSKALYFKKMWQKQM